MDTLTTMAAIGLALTLSFLAALVLARLSLRALFAVTMGHGSSRHAPNPRVLVVPGESRNGAKDFTDPHAA